MRGVCTALQIRNVRLQKESVPAQKGTPRFLPTRLYHASMRVLSFLLFALLGSPALALAQSPGTQASVPTPDNFFGFRMGTDRELAAWPEMRKYFETIAAASDRVELIDAGPTTDGNRLLAAVISAPENLTRLDAIKAANRQLADPRTLGDAQAQKLAEAQPVIVAIGASIHATEIGATQAANELLYTLATSRDPETMRVLREVVLVLFPSLNPDGHVMTVDWYKKWKGTEFEGGPMPWLYHRYAGHDINRDAFMLNLTENRSLARFFYRDWHPQVFLTMHQMGSRGPRFFVPPNYDPIDPNYDPLIWRTAGLLGHAMALAMEEDGRSGVVQNALYDYYWPGYEDSAPLGHNTVCLLTEVASVRTASPLQIGADELQGTARGLPEYRAQMNFPNPWPGGEWKLRDIVDYDLSAVRGLLSAAAKYRGEIVRNFYRMGARAIEAGTTEGPYAYIMPPNQHDPSAAHALRQLLIDAGVDVERALDSFRVNDTTYPPGTDLILMAQPFRAYVKTLLERQDYPARRAGPNQPPERPYDVAGWTLPWQMGVKLDKIEQSFDPPKRLRLEQSSITPEPLSGDRRPSYYLIDGRGNGATIAVNRLLAANASVSWTSAPLQEEGFTYAPGAIVVRDSETVRPIVERLAIELGLHATGARGWPPERLVPLSRPRVGLYKSWVENIDEGWTRWLLERYEFPYENLTDQDIRRGSLKSRLDVIILPDQAADRLLNGNAPGTMPREYVGGIGTEGAAALKQFVEAGGTLITLDSASELAVNTLGLPVKDVVRGASPDQFFCPGSLLRLELDPSSPLTYGMPPEAAAFFAFGGAYDLTGPIAASNGHAAAPGSVRAIGRYAQTDVLMSGWLEGAPLIAGRAAVVEARVGAGRAILFGIRPQHRAQSQATFRLLFNAIHTTQAR